MNELLFILTFVAALGLVLGAFRLGIVYIYAFMATVGTLAFFLAPLVVSIAGFAFALSELFYATLFFSTDVISEHYGKRKAHEIVWLVVVVSVAIALFTAVATMFIPHAVDFVQPHIKAILAISPRILLAGLVMFIVEQHLDVWLYHKIREKTKGTKLWLRNNLATGATQLLDVLVFYPLAFYGVYENLFELMLAALIFKLILAVFDTPFIYLSRKFRPKELRDQNG